MALDNLLLQNIYQIHGHSSGIDLFFVYLAEYSSYVFAIIFIAVAGYQLVCCVNNRKNLLWSPLLLLPGVLLVNYLLRLLISRERPFAALEEFSALIYHYYGNSFPSNHAAASFAIAGTIYLINPLVGKISFGMAVLVSISRIYVGVHYPSDVLAGGLLALVILCLVVKNKDFLEKKFQYIEYCIRKTVFKKSS